MGGGGLRILGHKKWHVWRRENTERVDRDEQQHAQQQRRLLLDQRRVEQERRAHTLEQQSQSTSTSQGRDQADDNDTVSVVEHVNFFQQEQEELEQRQQLQLAADGAAVGRNDRERKSSRRAQDQQETLGRQGHLPWYAKPSGDGDAAGVDCLSANKSRGEQRRKRALDDQDPLKHMRPRRSSLSSSSSSDERERERSKDAEERTKRVYRSDFSRTGRSKSTRANDSGIGLGTNVKSSFTEVEKKPKKHKKNKRKHREKDEVLQQLRRDREERETRERQRAEALMRGR